MIYRADPKDGVAWVTGASAGIGRALALELVARGYRVAATARRAAALAELAAATDGAVTSFPADVTDRAAMAALPRAIEAALGPIVLGVLNAGLYLPAERAGFSAALVAETFDVNLQGVANGLDPLLVAMRAHGRGQIALTSSLAAYCGIAGSAAYGASKAAVTYLAEASHLVCAPDNIRIQVIHPGFVQTAMTASNAPFDMPFLMDADAAARRICDGLERGGFDIVFPRRLAWTFKAACLLPYAILLPVMRRVTRRALMLNHR